MEMSSSPPESECPHVFLREHFYGGVTGRPISVYLANALTCVDCNILLQIIEAFEPGWVEQNSDHGSIDLHYEKPAVQVRQVMPKITLYDLPRWFQKRQTKSFHVLQKTDCPIYQLSVQNVQNVCQGLNIWATSPQPDYFGRSLAQSLVINEDSSSPAAFDRVRQWLSHCVEHDEACRPPDSEFMPRHLVNVGSWDGLCEPFLFQPTTPAAYACLSYCWGSDIDQVVTTTTENLQSHYRTLKLARLPPGIQDAIIVCRALKIPNLWVDSLCIIQDDKVAWLHDASKMYDVYSNSHLTIAVMEPNSCKSRFLGKQKLGDPSLQQIFSPVMPGSREGMSKDLLIRAGDSRHLSQLKRSSLDKRGWCLQESVLPNRRLCYDGQEMIWECLCRSLCECGHVVEPRDPQKSTMDYAKLGASLKIHRTKSAPPLERRNGAFSRHRFDGEESYSTWRNLVSDYSHRSLSKKNDKLRAISALAKLVGDNIQHETGIPDEYVAGLWKSQLCFDLMWVVKPLDGDETFPETGTEDESECDYHMPSWSWASLGKQVQYPFSRAFNAWKYRPKLIDICEVKSIDCPQELPEDPTSAVTDGSLILRGAFVPMKLVIDRRKDARIFPPSVFSNLVQGTKRETRFVQASNEQSPEVLRGVEVILDEPVPNAKMEDCYYCLRSFSFVAYEFRRSGSIKMGPQTWFLVLARSMHKEGAFERIGVGAWDGNFRDKRPCPLFEAAECATIEIV